MATKPTITFVSQISASDDNYTTGPAPLIGSLTKIAPPLAQITEAWKADQKPPAQWENFLINRRDVWLEWLELGQNTAGITAHVKEADSDGHTAFAALTAGDTGSDAEAIFVRPNSGAGETGIFGQIQYSKPAGIFETTDVDISALVVRAPAGVTLGGIGDVGVLRVETGLNGPTAFHVEAETVTFTPAVEITQTGTGVGIKVIGGRGDTGSAINGGPAVDAFSGVDDGGFAGGPAARFTGLSGYSFPDEPVVLIQSFDGGPGTGLRVDANSTMLGIDVVHTGGRAACIRAKAFDSGGSHRSAPLVLVPQAFSIAGDGVEDGAIWLESGTFDGGKQIHPRFHGDDSSSFHWGRNAMCAIYEEDNTMATGPGTGAFFDVLSGAEFPTALIPLKEAKVIIYISLAVHRTANGSDIEANSGALLEVIDVTATSAVIYSDSVDLHPLNAGDENRLQTYYSTNFEYSVPAGGQREFKIQMKRGTSPGGTSSITVTQVRFHLIAKH